jgi:antiviral helicase SKI2
LESDEDIEQLLREV